MPFSQDAPAARSDGDLKQQQRTREAALTCLQTLLSVDAEMIVGHAERLKRATAYCTVAVAAFGTLPSSVYKVAPEFGLRRAAFACLALLPTVSFEASAAGVTRLAAETLGLTNAVFADGGLPAASVTRSLCNHRDASVAGWPADTEDNAALEAQVRVTVPRGAASAMRVVGDLGEKRGSRTRSRGDFWLGWRPVCVASWSRRGGRVAWARRLT